MKKFNINEFLWFLILIGFAYYIYRLFQTDLICSFVHPKMQIYVQFSFNLFLVLAFFQFRRIFRSGYVTKIKLGMFIFIIPLLLGLVVSPREMGERIVARKGISLIPSSYSNDNLFKKEQSAHNPENVKKEMLSLDETNFLKEIDYIYKNLKTLKGKEITVMGFVYKEDIIGGKFAIARTVISCCAADAQNVGILCIAEGISIPEAGQWVRISGVIQQTDHYDVITKKRYTLPMIHAKRIENIKLPEEHKYIYR